MFYADNELEDITTCPRCGDRMGDPRILPCGNTICNDCIPSDNKHYVCYICNNAHLVPKHGFTRNESVIRLLKKRPHEIYRSRKVEELKSLLTKLKRDSKALEDGIKNSESKIQEYLDFVRCDIDLAAETAIQSIQNKRDKLLKEIDDYQADKTNFKSLEQNESQKYSITIEKMEEFVDKWQSYLRKFDIQENEIDTAIMDAKKQINVINRDYQEYQSSVFNNKIIQFKPEKSNENLPGSLKLSFLPGIIDMSNLRECDLNPYINDSYKAVDFDIFKDGRVLVVLEKKISNCIVFLIFNQDFRLISNKVMPNYKYLEDNESVGTIGNHIYCLLLSTAVSQTQVCLKIDSFSFNIEKQILIKEQIIDVSFNSKLMFLLTDNGKINIYDTDLKLLDNVGQSFDKSIEYYIPINTEYIFSNDDYLFIKTDTWDMLLLDSKDGKFVRQIKIDKKDNRDFVSITSESFIVYIESSSLRFMSQDGNKIYDNSLDKFKPFLANSCWCFRENNNLYGFIDSSLNKLYLQ